MLIDAHLHIGGSYDEAVTRRLDRGLVDVVVLSCLHLTQGEPNWQPTPDEIRAFNDFVLSWMDRYHGKVIGLCYVNPRHGDIGLAEMRRCLDHGMSGVKLEVCTLADDKRVNPFAALAAERDVPILAHAWAKTTGNLPFESYPQNVMALAQRFPKAKIILAHWGGEWETGAKVVRDCPNLYVDISGTPAEMDSVEGMVHSAGEDRVLFGTDNANLFYCLGKVLGAALNDSQRQKILWGNAARLFGLPH